ncbi:MAG: hypothetical protein JWN85_550 [Gammaproteobacteria bacterium]|nr:hypothetical protein [Gammaproteobacteria bacterium]
MLSFTIAGAARSRFRVLCALTSVALLSSPCIDAATTLSLSGAPAKSVTAAHYFAFQPGVSNPSGGKLSFAVSNKPSWATFDSASGRLYGTPIPPGNVGTFNNIIISASAGAQHSALPAFAITVLPLPNSPPTIAGSAATAVAAGQAYSFQPTARDPNGLRLSFVIANKPAWLAFDSTTGRLYGTPAVKDAGVYAGIVITAYDGYSKAMLPAFAISVQATAGQPVPPPPPAGGGAVTIGWLPPTQNADGSILTNLAGYRVYYGTTTSQLDHSVTITNPGLTRYVISNLTPATWYFALTAYNTGGQESDRSDIGSIVKQ